MFLCRRLGAFRPCSAIFNRNQVTISWPVKKGHDYLEWKKMQNWFLLDIKEEYEYYQSTKSNRLDYNTKIRHTKENIAKMMGIDPDHFTNTQLKLSLLYLLPSDIQRKEYKPSIPRELPVQSFLDIIAQYNGTQSKQTAIQSSNFTSLRKEISLVHSVVLDALEQILESPGLELFIDPEEVVILPDSDSEAQDDVNVAAENFAEPIDQSAHDLDSSINEVTDGEDHAGSADLVDSRRESSIQDTSFPETGADVEFLPALKVFPFVPIQTGSEVEKKTLQLQFNKLNHLIQDRPDLIRMYYPAIKHIIQDREIDTEEWVAGQDDVSPITVFRGKVNRVFLFNSVVTTVVPGSGRITIDNESYLDFFPEVLSRMIVIAPLRVTRTLGVFDINVTVDQENAERTHSLAHCIAMSIADCLLMYNPELLTELGPYVYRKEYRVEYKKANKKNSRRRYKWRKR
jgi:small subunit ribosomal protein S9